MGFESTTTEMRPARRTGFQQPHPATSSEGRVSRARHLLARPFSILSTAGRGAATDRNTPSPTINLARYEELVPKDGVYITRTRVGDECFDSVTNIGNRPTFGGRFVRRRKPFTEFHPLEVSARRKWKSTFSIACATRSNSMVEVLREQIGRDVGRSTEVFPATGLALVESCF